MKQIAEGFQITELKTIATCAVREAANVSLDAESDAGRGAWQVPVPAAQFARRGDPARNVESVGVVD